MCGICGFWSPEGGRHGLDDAQLLAMREAMRHRGPDDGDHWISEDGCAGLGSRRLAIIDLSPAGRMPIWNEDHTVAIVFNGECYNFAELRAELAARGHVFRSHTDTESVLHLYEESATPEEMLNRLRGMYAFAIWDSRRRRMLLARDRLGIKPLYYVRRGRVTGFASEVRALLASGLASGELDPVGVQGYFAMGAAPLPRTPLAGVRSLSAGHYLLLDESGEKLRRYWRLQFEEDPKTSEAEWIEQIRAALLDSVRRHLVADVPVGIFASGGIDSSALIALAREVECTRLRTYSVVFCEQEYSEAVFAWRIAEKYATEHHEYKVEARDVLARLDKIASCMDLPSFDGSNVYLVAEMTRSDGTIVTLSGLGGDEIFGGYASFRWVPRVAAAGRMAASIPGLGSLLRLASLRAYPGSRRARLRDLTSAGSLPAAYFAYRGLLDLGSLDHLLCREFAAAQPFDPVGYLRSLHDPLPAEPFNAVSALELAAWMHYQLLRDSDAMSMAHSLELRVPFLDHPLVELLARVPARLKAAGGRMPKHLLLKSLPSPLPAEIWDRPKCGFNIPFGVWLTNELRATAEECLLGLHSPLRSVCDARMMERLWKGFLKGRVRWNRIWSAVIFARWMGGLAGIRGRQVAEAGVWPP